MRGTHRRAAGQHELAAQAHRTAAEHNEKGGCGTAVWHSERAMECSDHAYKHTLWQTRGCPEGSPEDDWFRAAQELRARGESLPS